MPLYTNRSFINKMRFAKQSIDIPVGNIDEHTSLNVSKTKRHSNLLPNNLRCIISGPSGCGKTNVLISLIESEHGLKFENLYLYSKTLDQDKYKYLCEMLRSIKEIGCYTFSGSQNCSAKHFHTRTSSKSRCDLPRSELYQIGQASPS